MDPSSVEQQQFSPHFTRDEFEHSGPMPDECAEIFGRFCDSILEPTRAQFGQPLKITSGDRRAAANEACAGNLHSEHVSTPRYCAGDFEIPGWNDLRGVFDWIRLNSGLLFHHVTLEHQANGPDVIHISINLDSAQRIAKEGATHNAGAYIDWAVA